MRRFLITSEKFEGIAELIYNKSGQLVCIDMRQTSMDAEVIRHFKKAAPVTTEQMAEAFTAGTTVVETEFEISLDDFKREYPYGRNFHLLPDIWNKMNKTQQVEAYYGAIEYRKYCNRTDWYKPKIAASWLMKKEWMNDWRKM